MKSNKLQTCQYATLMTHESHIWWHDLVIIASHSDSIENSKPELKHTLPVSVNCYTMFEGQQKAE